MEEEKEPEQRSPGRRFINMLILEKERQSLREIDRSRDRLGTLPGCGTVTFTSTTNKTAKNYKYPTRCRFVFSLKVPWVPGSCSCRISAILYRWNLNSWWSDASCRRAAHRGCRALAPAFTHTISVFKFTLRISAISAICTVGILMCACERQSSTRAKR